MTQNNYLLAGVAALFAAVLHPMYWLTEVSANIGPEGLRTELGLLDGVFVILTGLTAYIYYSLKRILNEHCEYHRADTLLTIEVWLTISVAAVLLVVGVFFSNDSDLPMTIAFPVALLMHGAVDTILGIQLLRDSEQLPGLLKGIGVVVLLLGIVNLSLIMTFLTLILFPVFALMLALLFLREPEAVEFV